MADNKPFNLNPSPAGAFNLKSNSSRKQFTIRYKNQEGKFSKITIKIDSDEVLDISNVLGILENNIDSLSISIPSAVSSEASSISNVVSDSKNQINSDLGTCKSIIIDVMKNVDLIDRSVVPDDIVDMSFNELNDFARGIDNGSQPIPVNEDFFKNCEDCEILDSITYYERNESGNLVEHTSEGKFATVRIDGKRYVYDINGHRFFAPSYKYDTNGHLTYVGNEYVFDATIYAPQNATDYSKLNTYTYFLENDTNSNKKENEKYVNEINNYDTNCVVIRILKPKGDFNKYDETTGITKMVNKVANTDLENDHCRNIIAGDSAFGAHVLKIAASEGKDVYNTVICINNAVIVDGVNGKAGQKTGFDSLEDLKGLDGKEIYFISANGDPNVNCNYGKNGAVMASCSAEDSYLCTGIDNLCQQCPNARIHALYYERNAQGKTSHDDVAVALKSFDPRFKDGGNNHPKYKNFSYDGWFGTFDKAYHTHTDGNRAITYSVNLHLVNDNFYENG